MCKNLPGKEKGCDRKWEQVMASIGVLTGPLGARRSSSQESRLPGSNPGV